MARSDLLLSLVKSGVSGDQTLFRRTVEAIVAEERAKNHGVLADRLEEQLKRNGQPARNGQPIVAGPIAHDLFYETTPERTLADLVLPEHVRGACLELVEEFHRADLLRSHNLVPRHRVLLAGPPGNGKTSLAESRTGISFCMSPKTLADKLRGLSFAELKEFTADVFRRYVLAQPAADVKDIVGRRLKQWQDRFTASPSD